MSTVNVCYGQCDQIERFFAVFASIQSRWQQLFYANCPHCQAIFVKVSKAFIILVKSFLGNFYRHLCDFLLVTLVLLSLIKCSCFSWPNSCHVEKIILIILPSNWKNFTELTHLVPQVFHQHFAVNYLIHLHLQSRSSGFESQAYNLLVFEIYLS